MAEHAPLIRVEAPSNIALIKYWGKRDAVKQWPANDSLSMSLSVAKTITTARRVDGPTDQLDFGGPKASRHLDFLRRELGFDARLQMTTTNTFPSSCGIASSASGLSALTLAAIGAWTGAGSFAALESLGFSRERLARLAGMGSGSACRSLFGGFVHWRAGASPEEQTVVRLEEERDGFALADVIVILSAEPKAVSSTDAHQAAWSSPLYAARLAGLTERLAAVREALLAQDLSRLGPLLEQEALEMHAVMLTSTPRAAYWTAETSAFVCWLREERARGLEAYFTLDAGPNPHVICRPEVATTLARRIRDAFPRARLIEDRTGKGPTISEEVPL